ncbi:MAG TPA: TolC family protein [Candidatus Mcinerneyibacteriales bacterium]|nr:TolC family protein [Candidatus Mcinerneyibacteriales bacterium]
MKSLKMILLLAVFVSALTAASFGEEVLSLDHYMEKVTEKLPEIRQKLIAEEKASLNMIIADSYKDLTLSAGGSYSGTTGYSGYDYTNGLSLYTRMDKTLASTGATLSAGVEYDFTGTDTAGNTTERFSPALTLDVTQPLLKNYFGTLDKIPYLKSKLDLQIRKLQTAEDLAALRTDFTKLYYQWASMKTAMGLLEKRIENARLMEEEIIRRFRNNLADADDVHQSHSTVLTYKESYAQTKRSIAQLKKQLAPYIELEGKTPDLGLYEALWQRAAEFEFAMKPFQETRAYHILATTLEQAGLDITLSQEKTKPELNLSAGLTFKTQEDEFSDSYKIGDADYRVSLTFRMPLGNRAAKAGVSVSKLEYESLGLEIEKSAMTYEKSLGSLNALSEGNRELLELRRENLETLKSQYDAQRTKYNQARLELNSLIQTDNQITSEMIQINDLKYSLIENYLEYQYLTEQNR